MIDRLPRFITRNFQLKLIAIVVACGMWVGVVYASDPPAIQTYTVHVRAAGVLQSGLVLPRPIGVVAVKIAGVANFVRSSSVGQHLSATADLSHITKPGEYQVNLRIQLTDQNVWIWSAPKTVQVVVDREEKESIPVHLSVVAAPPVGYTLNLAKTVITPAEVTVSGPESVLSNVQAEVVLDLSKVRSSFPIQRSVKIINANGLGSEVTRTPNVVQVAVSIASETTQRELPVLPTFTSGGPPSGYKVTNIEVVPFTVTATGPASVVTGLTSVATDPIDLSHATASETVSATLVAPDGTTLSTRAVNVIITIAPVAAPSPTPTPTPTPAP